MLTKENRKLIQEEFIKIAKLMDETEDPNGKIFYYSGCFAMTNRVLNLQHDLELNLIDTVMNVTYVVLQTRYGVLTSDPNAPYEFPLEVLERLPDLIKRLARQIGKGEPSKALEEIATLCYVVSGNGYFLYKAGKMKLP